MFGIGYYFECKCICRRQILWTAGTIDGTAIKTNGEGVAMRAVIDFFYYRSPRL